MKSFITRHASRVTHYEGVIMNKSKVAILETSPATVLQDYHRLMNLAGYQDVIQKDKDTALKINISWHFFYPASSTTPWQLDGVIRAMKKDGYNSDLIHGCHNRTVVIDSHLGERENKHLDVINAHKLRNITAKLPRDKQREILPQIKEVYYATDYDKAKVLSSVFTDKFIDEYPSAVKCFNDDLEACLVYLKYPLGHRQFIRTTNLLERAFEEEKRRTKVFPQHSNEKALLGLVFSVLHNASLNWRRIAMKDSELKLLKIIRKLICPNYHNDDFISYKLVA